MNSFSVFAKLKQSPGSNATLSLALSMVPPDMKVPYVDPMSVREISDPDCWMAQCRLLMPCA